MKRFVLTVIASLHVLAACGRGDGSSHSEPGTMTITERGESVTSLHVGASGEPLWLVRPDKGTTTSLAGEAGVLATWPDVTGETVLAQTHRREGRGLASLVFAPTGAVSLVLHDTGVTEPRRVAFKNLNTREMDDSTNDLSFDELCRDREPVWRTPQNSSPMSAWDLASNADETLWLALVRTCGYVEALIFDAAGTETARHVLFEPTFKGVDIRVFLAMTAKLVAGRTALATILVEDDPSLYQEPPESTVTTLKVTVLANNGTVARQVGYAAPAEIAVYGFAAEEGADGNVSRIAVAGAISTPTLGLPNDSDQADAWLSVVDLATGAATAIHTLHYLRDDFYRTAAFTADGGVVAAGDTDRHHVDSGSWDGGSQILMTRYDQALAVQETLVFGEGRADVAHEAAVLADRVVITGTWNGIPNNHLPEAENWFQGFAAFFPLSGWAAP